MGFGFGDHMAWMWLWWLAGIAALVALVWGMARASGGAPPSGRGEDSPETLLKRRYARGELGREDYERALNELRK